MSGNGQLTYHSVDSKGETGTAYVFSLKPDDYKSISHNEKESTKLNNYH